MESNSPCHKEGCRHPAQMFFFTPTTQRTLVCKRHRPKLSAKTYSIAQVGLIEHPQDESLFHARAEEVKFGRKVLETVKKKAGEELKSALAMLDSEKQHTVEVVVKTYNSMIRRVRQHHQQITIALQTLSDELEVYLTSKETTLSAPLSYLLVPGQNVSSLLCVNFVTPDLELTTLLNHCFSMSESPLKTHLSRRMCPVDKNLFAYQRFLQAKYSMDSHDFIELQQGMVHVSEAIELTSIEGAEALREKLTRKISDLKQTRDSDLVILETDDAQSVKLLISTHQEAIFAEEQLGNTQKVINLYEELIDLLVPHSQSITAACIYQKFGDLCMAEDSFERAKQVYEDAIGILTAHFPTNIETASCYSRIAKALTALRQFAKAKESLICAHRIAVEMYPFHLETAEVYRNFAKVYALQQRYEKAAEYYEDALRILKSAYPERIETLDTMMCLGEVFVAANR